MNLRTWYHVVRGYATRQDGQTMVEYGLILALIAIEVVSALLALNGQLTNTFNSIVGTLKSSSGGTTTTG
jgi:pilus assembly protein Flp/PilA